MNAKTVSNLPIESSDCATCPLCGRAARAAEGVVEAHIALLACEHCRTFVMEKRLIDVVMNARTWNLTPVLRHTGSLSRAARQAAEHGAVLFITATNWIRLANEQQRVEASVHARRPDAFSLI